MYGYNLKSNPKQLIYFIFPISPFELTGITPPQRLLGLHYKNKTYYLLCASVEIKFINCNFIGNIIQYILKNVYTFFEIYVKMTKVIKIRQNVICMKKEENKNEV